MTKVYMIAYEYDARGPWSARVTWMRERGWSLNSYYYKDVYHLTPHLDIKCMLGHENNFRTMNWSEVPDYLRAQVMMLVCPD